MEADGFRTRLTRLRSAGQIGDPRWCAESIGLAMDAAEGNIGVGAVIVGPGEKVCSRGMNRLFEPSFSSDLHAEMDAINRFEELSASAVPEGEYRLYSSLEPCPMCLTRILFSGIRVVRYAAVDPEGGMATRVSQLPPLFAAWADDCDIAPAAVGQDLARLAADVHRESLDTSLQRLDSRWRRLRTKG